MRIEVCPRPLSGSDRLGRGPRAEDNHPWTSTDRAYCQWAAERSWEDDRRTRDSGIKALGSGTGT